MMLARSAHARVSKYAQAVKLDSLNHENSLKNLLILVSICFFSNNTSLNKEQQCACIYAHVVAKLVAKKSTKQSHFSAASMHTTLNKPLPMWCYCFYV